MKDDYNNKKHTQTIIALFISRLSPVCCYLNVLSEISGTGISELFNFNDHAQQFQHYVEKNIYNNYTVKRYYDRSGVYTSTSSKQGIDEKKIKIPHMTNYKHVTLTKALQVGWIDILFLLLFAVILFSASYVSFIKYDVR